MSHSNNPLPLTDQEYELIFSGVDIGDLPDELVARLRSTPEGCELLAMTKMMSALDGENEFPPPLPEQSVDAYWGRLHDAIEEEARVKSYHREQGFADWYRNLLGWWHATLSLLPEALKFKSARQDQNISEPDPNLIGRGYPMTEDQKRSLENIMREQGYFQEWDQRRRMIRQLRFGLTVMMGVLVFGTFMVGNHVHSTRMHERIARLQGELDQIADSGGVFELKGVGSISVLPNTNLRLHDMRVMELASGEAWFDIIPKGKGFEVQTAMGDVHVTGTSFGVSGSRDNFKVDVIAGSVELKSAEEKYSLSAGQMALLNTSDINIDRVGDWGTERPYWVEAINDPSYEMPQGVIPYQLDQDTALLLHFDEPAGTLSSEVEKVAQNEPVTHVIRNAGIDGKPFRTFPDRKTPDRSPFKDQASAPGLGKSATVRADGALAGAFVPKSGEKKFDPTTDLIELQTPNNDMIRIYRNSDQGIKFNDQSYNTKSFTIEAWIRNEKGYFEGKEPTIFHLRDIYDLENGCRFINFGLTTAEDGKHQLYLAYSTSLSDYEVFTSGETMPFEAGKWYHVAVVYDHVSAQSQIQFYVDEESDEGNPHRKGSPFGDSHQDVPDVAPFNGGNDGAVEVGGLFQYGNNSLNGSIDEVRYSNIKRDKFNLYQKPIQLTQSVAN